MSKKIKLGDGLTEIKGGIGPDWANVPVYGATVDGLAPAKEPPGKSPHKYKPVTPGTIFYNPMRILIGSVAFVSDDDAPGMTSPDYVVFRGNEGCIDSLWFYYWLRSPLGHECILSLARGAVRERMLFNRLAEAEVSLPDFDIQQDFANKLRTAQFEINSIKSAIDLQLRDIRSLPHRIVAASFGAE
ncbi:restriction endonuclease S subunit [Amaricoccus macauensis]|uniref:Restriction endonuclease S subunit n=1 Tax=Amaricoccus macauensis TaxID=57001 RepID=A0A840SJW2_9RHOB|nr:restriction endonuclease subunit S [Amaricoccus macauensis]MBB5220176.1 restriction endonuclease S subunit [Amaricoccus macauensis]MCB1469007.1 restriction endonuclease subunit S [Rhizobiaceae bacterium]